ncbi:hypothetical protein [Bremerella cremea]|uniref:AAA family ATPase n=1 Tax=Bremerella cremea TaxID=1031537 RepID=UPI0031EEB514
MSIIDRVDKDLAAIRSYFEQSPSQCDLVLLESGDDLQETRSAICGIQILISKPIIIFGVARSASDVIQFIRSGATDFVEMSGDFLRDLEDSITRLVESQQRPPRSSQIISFVSAVGGAGQTAIATNCAAHFTKSKHKNTVVADLNLTGGDVSDHLGIRPSHSIADCPRELDEISSATLLPLIESHKSGLKLLAGPEFLGTHSVLPAESVRCLVSGLAELHEVVVLDVEDSFHKEQQAALMCSDIVVIVTRLDFTSLLRTKRLLEHFEDKRITNIAVVANRLVPNASLPPDKVETVLKRPLAAVIPDEPASVLNGVNMGEPAVLEFPRSKFSKAIAMLCDKLSAMPLNKSEIDHVPAEVT